MDPTVAQILAARARSAPTPLMPSRLPLNGLYPLPSATPPEPLPSYLPQNVQNYIRTQPSYGEGDVQAPYQWYGAQQRMAQDTPSPSYRPRLSPGDVKPLPMDQPYVNPQPGDVQRLFHQSILRNATTHSGFSPEQLRALMQQPGFSGFTGGEDI